MPSLRGADPSHTTTHDQRVRFAMTDTFTTRQDQEHDYETESLNVAMRSARRRTRSTAAQSPLETYLREINETSLLSAEEELMLAALIAEGDVEARDRMVRANLRLVVNIARGYTGKGLGLQDLIEE
ncbi:MAG: sigma-70 factor domain-containing protein, partial [Planctomycetota bacterium]